MYIVISIHRPVKIIKLIVPLIFVFNLQVFSQAQASVSKPGLTYFNDTLIITFDIRDCPDKAIFNINPRIFKSDGTIIEVSDITGDLGNNIKCGNNKSIIWNLAGDNFRINGNVDVQIFAEQVIINEPVVQKSVADKAQNITAETEVQTRTGKADSTGYNEDLQAEIGKMAKNIDNDASVTPPLRIYSRGNIIASSFVFPGLGQKKVTRKGFPLLLGVLGYGGLVASGYFLYDYNKKYDQYLGSEIKTESDKLYDDSEKSYQMAQYFIYGAAGVWAVNLIWSSVIPASRSDNFNAGMSTNDIYGIQFYAKWTF